MSRFCRRADDSLPAYRDGVLPPRRQRQVEEHLRACPECRQRLAALDRATAALERLQPVTPPSGMLDAFHARLAAARPAGRPAVAPRLRPRWAGAGMAAAMALAAAWLFPGQRTAETVGPLVVENAPVRPAPAPPAAAMVSPAPAQAGRKGPAQPPADRPHQNRRRTPRRAALRMAAGAREQHIPAPAQATRPEAPAASRPVAGTPSGLPRVSPDPSAALATANAAPAKPPTEAAPAECPVRVEITAQTVALIDPETGERRQILVARTVNTRTGQVHVTLSSPAPTTTDDEGPDDI